MESHQSTPFGYVGRVKNTSGSTFYQGRISNSVIKHVPDPVDADDPVTLKYLRQYTGTFVPYSNISLEGTDWVQVDEDVVPFFGNRSVTVNGTTEGAPNAQWQICRSNRSDFGIITQGVFSPIDGDCVLQLRWLPQTLLQVRKTNDDFDGVYEVTVNR